jgi:hypothetical protein
MITMIVIRIRDSVDGSWKILKRFPPKVVGVEDKKFLWWTWQRKVLESGEEIVKRAVLEARELLGMYEGVVVCEETWHENYNFWENGRWITPACAAGRKCKHG